MEKTLQNNKVIFGDNLSVLQSDILLKYKIKMVYIDPPYNTLNEKSYIDKNDTIEWNKNMLEVISNISKIMKDDGVFFASIDDNEYANLKLICDKVFGKENFLGTFITNQSQRSNSKFINTVHEYIICYAKNKNKIKKFSIKRMDIPKDREMILDIDKQVKYLFFLKGRVEAEKRLGELISYYCDKFNITWLKNYRHIDENGDIYFATDLSVPGKPRTVNIETINLHLEPLATRGWVSDKKFIELHNANLLIFLNGRPYYKKFLKDAEDNAQSILNYYSRYGTKDLEKLGLYGLFDTPKPVELIKFLIRLANLEEDDYILDCYAGSGTTGQSVIEINIEDNKKINFILIQNNEQISIKSSIYKNCKKYNILPYISNITKVRLDKVCEKYKIHNIEYIEYENFTR